MIDDPITQLCYLAAAALFIFSLRWLSRPEHRAQRRARGRGGHGARDHRHAAPPAHRRASRGSRSRWSPGTLVGVPLSRVPLTAVPQRTAISHAFGGLAAGLVGTAKYSIWLGEGELTVFRTIAIVIEVILGFLTFTGSLMAAGKLQEVIPTRPITYRGQNAVNFALLGTAVLCGVAVVIDPVATGRCSA